MHGARRHYVFGYGSLLERRSQAPETALYGGGATCELRNFRRTWNVAMDNTRTIPGYKHYVDATTGAREPWFVAFLDIVPEPGARVNGVLFEVSDDQLERLDQRERNYERIEVSAHVSLAVDGDVWAYMGSDAARSRFRRGRSSGRAVISREYYRRVLEDFAHIGPEAAREFTARTDPPPCPIVDLRRIDHPAGPGRGAGAEVAVAGLTPAPTGYAPVMAPISAKVHGIADYATGAAMLATPIALRIDDRRAAGLLWGAGAATIAASVVSDHEVALLRKLPMPVHLLLDASAGLSLAGAGLGLAIVPWTRTGRRSGLSLPVLPWPRRRRRVDPITWVPHAAFGIGEVALAALTERRPAPRPAATGPELPDGPERPAGAGAASEPGAGGRPVSVRPSGGLAEAERLEWEARLPPDPDELQPGRDDDTLVAREASAAAAEAAMIGGAVPPEVDDPALDPVYQAGGGEQDGWEAAEAELIENATHGEGGGDPLRDALPPEVESDRSGAVYGEGDRILSTEVVADPGAGEEDPAAGPGLTTAREPQPDPGPDG